MRWPLCCGGVMLLIWVVQAAVVEGQSPQDLGRLAIQAGEYEQRENYPAAIETYQKALETANRLYGPNHEYAAALNQAMAMLHLKLGQYEKARGLLEKVVAISQATKDNEMLAEAVNNLAAAEWELGRYPRARELHEYSLKLASSQYGEQSVQVAIRRSNLAGVCASLGQYAEAEPLYEQSVRVLERHRASHALTLADTLGNHANLYLLLGETARAQAILLRAVSLKEAELGPHHHEVARSLNNLAAFYSTVGQFAKAEEIHLRVLRILETSLGAEHLDTCRSVLNLANVFQSQKQYDKALPYYQRALRTREAQLEHDHPDIALTLHNMAALYLELKDFERADDCLQRALQIRRSRFGVDHPHVATTLTVMADAHSRQQQFVEAEQLWNQARAIRESRLLPGHPALSATRHGHATVFAATERWEEAADSFDLSRRGLRKYADQVLPALSEAEQLNFLSEIDEELYHSALSLALQKPEHNHIVDLSAGWVLNGKSVAQQTLAQRALLMRDATNPLLEAIAEIINVLRKQLASLYMATADEKDEPARRRELENLQREEQEQSRLLVFQSGRAQGSGQWIETAAVREQLSEDAVLVEIARFRHFNFREYHPKQELTEHYVAWIIPPAGDEPIQVVDLGEAESIDAAVTEARVALQQSPDRIVREGELDAEQKLRPSLEKLANQILYPLLETLGDRHQIYLSPDSNLWLVPWSALPLSDGSYSIERYDIRFVVSGRNLVRNPTVITPGRPIMMADPNYDLNPTEIQAAFDRLYGGKAPAPSAVRPTRQGISRLGTVARLPGTKAEANAVKPKLAEYAAIEPYLYTDELALEGVFKKLRQPRVLVLSTHGFFQEMESREGEAAAASSVTNPLLRCGLLLAGCNKPPAVGTGDSEDGILTGLEIIGTDLRGTQLVVLSACETGLGDVRTGEGVAGLRQAFQLAGAQAVIATLWTIPDRETALLISDYFSRLAATGDQAASLRAAQLAMIEARRDRHEAAHPYFWAAFTITGE